MNARGNIMSTIQSQGEQLKKAVQWLSDKRKESPEKSPVLLAQEAAIQFDLKPDDSEFLIRFVKDPESQNA